MLRARAYATTELVSRVKTTAPTVMNAVLARACGKLVRSHASAKFAQLTGFGHSKPVPCVSCSGVLRATTTARYSGTRTVSEQTAMRAVAHQLVLRVSSSSV